MLVARYPREQWQGHPNLGEMARFWLSRHDMFRELSAAIEEICRAFPHRSLSPAEFPRQFVPRLQFMLEQLDVHHQIEDLHYFPIFRAADERLARGFDVLEGDHHAIHADMAATADTANALLRALGGGDISAAATTTRLPAARCLRAGPPSRRRGGSDRAVDPRPRRRRARRRASRLRRDDHG